MKFLGLEYDTFILVLYGFTWVAFIITLIIIEVTG